MNGALRIFGAPSRYIQGAGALSSLGEVVSGFSRACFVVADGLVLDLYRGDIAKSCEDAGVSVCFSAFGGECTYAEIARIAAQVKDVGVVVGFGGGKAIDTAKGVGLELGLCVVIVPTIASNDSPTSRLVVVYDEDHHIVGVELLPRNPDAVLVDSAIIAKAPVRFLVSGIGDAISKKFEADLCARSNGLNFYGGRQTMTALALSEFCYHQIRQYALKAVEAAGQGLVTPELDAVIEAAILQSGLGFENGGLAIAHGLIRGMARQRDAQGALHGELVAWGLLVQLIADSHDATFVADLRAFHQSVGLPVQLSDIGFDSVDNSTISAIAETTWSDAAYVRAIDGMSAERLAASIRQLEDM